MFWYKAPGIWATSVAPWPAYWSGSLFWTTGLWKPGRLGWHWSWSWICLRFASAVFEFASLHTGALELFWPLLCSSESHSELAYRWVTHWILSWYVYFAVLLDFNKQIAKHLDNNVSLFQSHRQQIVNMEEDPMARQTTRICDIQISCLVFKHKISRPLKIFHQLYIFSIIDRWQ